MKAVLTRTNTGKSLLIVVEGRRYYASDKDLAAFELGEQDEVTFHTWDEVENIKQVDDLEMLN